MCNFCCIKRGNQHRQVQIQFRVRNADVFGTFEGHLQKVLSWKENPDEFIQELVDQDTRDSLHDVIKEKLNSK